MHHKSWVFEFIVEIIFDSIFYFIFFILIYYGNDNFLFSLIVSFSPILIVRLHKRFILRKLPGSKLYRLPLLKYEGVIIEKRIHKFPANCFFYEYIIFHITGGHQIKAYIPASGSEHRYLYAISNCDKGTLYYRKNKNYNYFEEFEKHEPDAEDCPDLT